MSITSNLYPPIVMDTLPSFVRTQSCRIYFSLSAYNAISDIKNVQVSITNQKTNASALKPSLYSSGIMLTDLLYDSSVVGDYPYYVQINPSDLADGAFGLNQFYKVQLRFTNIKAPDPTDERKLAKWLYDNMQYFSEWSKVCLIKGIEQPYISIRGFDNVEINQQAVITTPLVAVAGKLYFNNSEETEYLKNYNIKLYTANDLDNPVFETEEIYTNQYVPNEINYEMEYILENNADYVLVLNYTTNNLYSNSVSYRFKAIQHQLDPLDATITATIDEENGRAKVQVISNSHEVFLGNLTIRRSSSENDFKTWEDVKTVTYATGTELNLVWYDETIESGVWYKYCAQKRSSRGDRGAIIQTDEPVMCVLDSIFLTRDDCQLKIKFNPSLNEFKYNVTESQQTTLGGKYPYIKRNGNNYFRSFPIGGLISSFIDTSDWYDPHFYDGSFHPEDNEIGAFTTKEEIYGESLPLYENYNAQHNINEYQDYVYERKFREKVYDFLYKHNVKLFRSATEGNILVKLMNIDFQPVESLGRRLYSFTATAIEVDEASIKNYNKYGIQVAGTYEKFVTYQHQVLGQIQDVPNNENLLTTAIASKYQSQAHEGFTVSVKNLSWLRIEMTSEPAPIIDYNGSLQILPSSSRWSPGDYDSQMAGYIIEINGKDMIVPADGIFETNVPVTNLKLKWGATANIDFIANLEETETEIQRESIYYYFQKVGQLYGTFEPNEALVPRIFNKYFVETSEYTQYLLRISKVRVEGDPGAVVYIKEEDAAAASRYVLESSLEVGNNSNIASIAFGGIHLIESENPLIVREYEYVAKSGTYSDVSEIIDPVPNGVYNVGQGKKVYYHETWYDFSNDHDVICPVNGIVDYYGEVVKGVY